MASAEFKIADSRIVERIEFHSIGPVAKNGVDKELLAMLATYAGVTAFEIDTCSTH
jgi:hypothetical protein